MSIRTYFKPKDGLPNPKGPLSQSIPSQAIALVNIDNDRENCGAPSHKLALQKKNSEISKFPLMYFRLLHLFII